MTEKETFILFEPLYFCLTLLQQLILPTVLSTGLVLVTIHLNIWLIYLYWKDKEHKYITYNLWIDSQAATLLSNHCRSYWSLSCLLQATLAYPHQQCKRPIVRSYFPLSPLPCSLPIRCSLWQFRAYDHDNKGEERQREKWLEEELVRKGKRRPMRRQGSQCLYRGNLFRKDGAFCDLHAYSFPVVDVNNYYHVLRTNSPFHITELLSSTAFFFSPCSSIGCWCTTSAPPSWRGQSGKGTAVPLCHLPTSQWKWNDLSGPASSLSLSLSPCLSLDLPAYKIFSDCSASASRCRKHWVSLEAHSPSSRSRPGDWSASELFMGSRSRHHPCPMYTPFILSHQCALVGFHLPVSPSLNLRNFFKPQKSPVPRHLQN